jgi:4-aminobutyrate aminotransferase / (S)-3-amino-2-methylpropionate transaminase / 5-aminovalerate transaminase
VLDVIEDEGLCDRSAAIGETIRSRMRSWQERWPEIGDVRGLGAMTALELVANADTKEPAPDVASRVVEEAARRGLLMIKSGMYGNCIRVLVPLVVSDAELDEGLDVWAESLEAVLG